MPDISLGYFSQTIIGNQEVDGTSRNFGSGYRFSGFQAGLSLPIWFAPYTAKTKAAKIVANIASTDADNYSKSIEANYNSLTDELKKFSASVDYYEKQAVPEAELIIRQATLSYKAGALDYLDYVSTLNMALMIRQNYLDALNDCNQTIISIEYITGKIF